MKYILALDQGTSSSRAILFDSHGLPVGCAQREFPQHFPGPGLVEHEPEDIWESQCAVAREVLAAHPGKAVCAIGITNQRETTILWDADTGLPVHRAIVWQDRRTAAWCDFLRADGQEDDIRKRTGLLPDAYFSASKIKWILDHVEGARDKAERGRLRFGTVDSFLVWKLTGGRVHVTDVSNASRTMLFNIHTLRWDEALLERFGIPASILPRVASSSEVYGETACPGLPPGIPIAGIAGDQQAALFGQRCLSPGTVKNTYGTGCFLLMNTGERPVQSANRLLTTVAWKIGGKVSYALEGSVFVAGSIVQWLRDGLGIIHSSAEVEEFATRVADSGGVYFVPALTGLGAPYWSASARGTVTGISRGTTAAHIARAALEGIAFQTRDIVRAMESDAGLHLECLKVDGGASRNDFLMQFQADILPAEVVRGAVTETTALGAAFLAGLAVGVWDGPEALPVPGGEARHFLPALSPERVAALCQGWERAVAQALQGTI